MHAQSLAPLLPADWFLGQSVGDRVQIEAEVQTALVVAVQQLCRPAQRCSSCEWTVSLLLAANRRQCWAAAHAATKRLPAARSAAALEDLAATAALVFVQALEEFSADAGTQFPAWLHSCISQQLSKVALNELPVAGVPESWQQVARTAHAIAPALSEELGRQPSIDELRARLGELNQAHARRLALAEDPGLEGERLEAAVRSRTVKIGWSGALKNLSAVLAVAAFPLHLDAPAADGGATLGDLVAADVSSDPARTVLGSQETAAALVDAAFGSFSPAEREAVTGQLVDREKGESVTYATQAASGGFDAVALRRLSRTAQARLRAPHAQFAYVAAAVESAQDEQDPLSLLRARV